MGAAAGLEMRVVVGVSVGQSLIHEDEAQPAGGSRSIKTFKVQV